LLRGITGLLSCKNPTFYLDKNPTHFKKNFRYFSVLYKSVYYHSVVQIVVSRRAFGMVEPWVGTQLARRAAPEGVQSPGAGGGDFAMAGRGCGSDG
jgi:hypothetical protein